MSAFAIRTARVLLTEFLLIGGLAACSESATGPDSTPSPGPAPAPTLTTVYDLDVVVRYIEVRASCDRDFLGNFDPGEFQYKIDVTGKGKSYGMSSKGYNSVTGDNFQRNGGTTIDFTNETYTWRGLASDADITVKLSGAEWDGLGKDAAMANRSGSVAVPFKLGTETLRVTVGADGNLCQIRLVYDAKWSERVVSG